MPPLRTRNLHQWSRASHARYVAIDPGASGGIAWVQGSEAWAVKMPGTEPEVLDTLYRAVDVPEGIPVYACIEKVGGYMPSRDEYGDGESAGGKTRQPGHTMFVFGAGVGGLRMAVLALLGHLPQEIAPQAWQKGMAVVPRKRHKEGRKLIWDERQSAFKGRLKTMAQQLFPSLKVTLSVSDALLMAWWLRLSREGPGRGQL